MKYTLSSDIARPRATVVELFNNPHNWPKWQDTLVRSEALEGAPGDRGSKTKLIHKFRRREVEMIETIESEHLPDEMTCVYEAPGAWNRVVYRFAEVGPNETRSFSEGASRALREFMKPNLRMRREVIHREWPEAVVETEGVRFDKRAIDGPAVGLHPLDHP